jgi:hypothetical protein
MLSRPSFSAGHTARRRQDNLAQGLPWVSQKNVLALKGPETTKSARSPVGNRFSPDLTAPSGLIPVRELTQGKPWAMLSWPLRATDYAGSVPSFPLCDLSAMPSPSRRSRSEETKRGRFAYSL